MAPRRSTRLREAQQKQQQQQQQQQQPTQAVPPKKKKREATKKAAPTTSGVKKPTKVKAAGAGKKETKKAAEKVPVKKTTKKPTTKTKKKKKKGPSVVQSEDEDEPEDENVPDAPGPSAQPESSEEKGGEGAAAPAPAPAPGMAHQYQEDIQAVEPTARPVTHEEEPVVGRAEQLSRPGYDGVRKILDNLLGRNADYLSDAAFSTAKDEFQYKGVRWVREKEIGRGSFGKADLYVQQDRAGNIVQRIVVKTTSVPHSMWIQARRWHVDERDPTKREHIEIKVMEAIASVEGDHKCVRLQHYTTDRSTFSYRLYIGYLPRGELSHFTKKVSIYKKGNNIPEPVLWKWLEDLTEASLLLSTGAAPRSDAADGWKKIVHCDFKPVNVFLDNPDAKLWRYYPQAVVGDFGLSIFTDENDPFNPTWYNAPDAGTDGWIPPEQMMFVDPTNKRLIDTGKLGDASNVWAIGAIIMRLMNSEKTPKQPRYEDNYEEQMQPQLNRDARGFYSEYLCDLVDECVQFRTYHRIKLPDLWDRIERITGEASAGDDPDDDDDKDEIKELKDTVREQKYGDGDDEHRLEYPEEKYKIGMAGNNDEAQGDEELDRGEDLDVGENAYGADLGGADLNAMFSDEEDLNGPGGRRGLYPGDRHIDEDYDVEEDDDY